jgi:hypothetical protein
MATAISFNGTSLQTNNIHTRSIDHESLDTREVQFQRLGARDGAKLVDDTFAPKVIRLSGIIIGSSQSDLEDRIDDLKMAVMGREKNLDIAYVSGTRRYKATCTKYSFSRDYYNITFAGWEAEFTVSDPPFGTPLDTTTIEYSAITQAIGTWETNGTFAGTYRPFPIIKMTVNSETSLGQIAFTNSDTAQQIKVAPASGYSAGDVLLINTTDYTVTINGTAVDYEGVIPDFVQGGNNFVVSFIGTAWNVTMKLIYYELYL